jgi:hypothetical protein
MIYFILKQQIKRIFTIQFRSTFFNFMQINVKLWWMHYKLVNIIPVVPQYKYVAQWQIGKEKLPVKLKS